MAQPSRERVATRFRILDQIPASGRVSHGVSEKPHRVVTLIDRSEFERTGRMVHNVTVFLEDPIHDWTWRNGQFRYFSRISEVADVALVYEETERTL